jgi:quinohemoprotein amine dehydrogenase
VVVTVDAAADVKPSVHDVSVASAVLSGFFTPASDGPNPERSGNRNNYGDIWVVATAKTEKDATGQPLTARSYLVVTIPAYKRWDNPAVSQ